MALISFYLTSKGVRAWFSLPNCTKSSLDLRRKRCQIPKGVPIAIATMQWGAIAGMDALHHPGPGREFEVAIGLDGHPPDIGAHVYAFRDHGSHHIPGPKAV